MLTKSIVPTLLILCSTCCLTAQSTNSDSAAVAKTLQEVLRLCKSVDFADPKVLELGTFYKVAPYIVYRGEDKKRAWKDFANYKDPIEKTGVDNVCFKINSTVNQDSTYKITGYRTEHESEGTWYALEVSYMKKGLPKKATYAFLKIGNRFGLGDID